MMKNLKSVILIGLFVLVAPIAALEVSERVLGLWHDGYWYPGTVLSIDGGKVQIGFDDGDSDTFPANRAKPINWTTGKKVQCNWKSEGKYYSGTITQMSGDSIHIAYDDGDEEDTTIGHCRSR